MNKLASEILFNRGLLWILLAYVRALHEDKNSKYAPFLFFAAAIYNFWKSYKAWEVDG